MRLTSAGKALVEDVHEPLLASNRALFRHMSESELVNLADGLARALAGPLSSGRESDDAAGSKPPPSSEVERVEEGKRVAPRRRKSR